MIFRQTIEDKYNETRGLGGFNKIIGYSNINMSHADCYLKMECDLGNFITDAMKTLLKTDIAWIQSGIIGASLVTGQLTESTFRDIVSLTSLISLSLRGKDLFDIVQKELLK